MLSQIATSLMMLMFLSHHTHSSACHFLEQKNHHRAFALAVVTDCTPLLTSSSLPSDLYSTTIVPLGLSLTPCGKLQFWFPTFTALFLGLLAFHMFYLFCFLLRQYKLYPVKDFVKIFDCSVHDCFPMTKPFVELNKKSGKDRIFFCNSGSLFSLSLWVSFWGMTFLERRWDQWFNGYNKILIMFIKKDQQSFIIMKAILNYKFGICLPQCVILKKNQWLCLYNELLVAMCFQSFLIWLNYKQPRDHAAVKLLHPAMNHRLCLIIQWVLSLNIMLSETNPVTIALGF